MLILPLQTMTVPEARICLKARVLRVAVVRALAVEPEFRGLQSAQAFTWGNITTTIRSGEVCVAVRIWRKWRHPSWYVAFILPCNNTLTFLKSPSCIFCRIDAMSLSPSPALIVPVGRNARVLLIHTIVS